MIAAGVTEIDDMTDPKNDIFDIRDDDMEIDDAVASGNTIDEPTEIPISPDSSNWQTELVRKAKESGMSDEIIQKLQGSDAVDDIVSIIAGSLKSSGETAREVPEVTKDENEFELGLDEATAFDPDAARAMKAMNSFYNEKIRRLEKSIENISDKNGTGTVSAFVKSLGPEWNGVFGSGNKPNPEAMKTLEESVQTIRAGYAARHKRVPADGELMKMALNASFGDKTTEIARNKFTDKMSSRQAQILSRPGTRTTSNGNPRMRAAQGVADWFKSRGIDPYAASEDNFQ